MSFQSTCKLHRGLRAEKQRVSFSPAKRCLVNTSPSLTRRSQMRRASKIPY
ncbi:unnamed protein product [Penicillium roqueforti FM164]|uniref:Uncharacterized protein n=1 Tax=Penicillium roqueforti (strain FM164) TaxID=1365484 RepID=W6QM88_PENRF|nr:unnamed protein product [Penicillium roqueforti FM164]